MLVEIVIEQGAAIGGDEQRLLADPARRLDQGTGGSQGFFDVLLAVAVSGNQHDDDDVAATAVGAHARATESTAFCRVVPSGRYVRRRAKTLAG